MTTYYSLDNVGNITNYANHRYNADCLETDRPIIRAWDGKLYFAGEEPSPPEPTLEEARAAKTAEIMSAYEDAFAPVSAIYPITEREGWRVQEAEARAVLADPAADAPVLTIMAAQRGKGESVTELALAILDRVAEYQRVYASLTGQQQRMYGEIMALDNADAIHAYPVEYQTP